MLLKLWRFKLSVHPPLILEFVAGSELKSIGASAFAGHTFAGDVDFSPLGSGLVIGDKAFQYSVFMRHITLSTDVSYGTQVYDSCQIETVTVPAGAVMGNLMFYSARGLKTVRIDTDAVADGAFGGANLTSATVTLGKHVRVIGVECFRRERSPAPGRAAERGIYWSRGVQRDHRAAADQHSVGESLRVLVWGGVAPTCVMELASDKACDDDFTYLISLDRAEKHEFNAIAQNGFADCPHFDYIRVPDMIEIIGENAFTPCSATDVKLGDKYGT